MLSLRSKTLGWAAAAALTLGSAGSMMAQTISSTSPATVAAGGATFTITVNGSGFSSNFVDYLFWTSPGSSTPTILTPLDPGSTDTQFTVSVPATLVATPGNATIQACSISEGYVCGPSASFPIGIQLTSLSPAFTLAGSGQSITVNVNALGGLQFGAQFYWNGTTLLNQPGSPSATNAVVTIPASLINPVGSGTITAVVNSQTSNGLTFNAFGPSTSSISPSAATAGSAAIPLTINGANLGTVNFGSPQVLWTFGSTTTPLTPSSSNGTVMNVTIPASLLLLPGTATVRVQNFAASSGPISNGQTFQIVPLPVVTSAVPATIPYNTASLLTVSGAFNLGDQIVFNGTTLTTTGTTNQLQATVPATLLTTLGPVTVRAVNSLGGLSTTSSTVTVIPVITSLNPPSVAAASGSFSLTVNVTGGLNYLSTVSFSGANYSPTSITATQATITIPANAILSAGLVPVSISNNGGTSAPVNFTIAAPSQPTITLVSPNSVGVGSGDTVVSVTGTNFKLDASPNYSGARVIFTPPAGPAVGLVPTSNTGTVLTVTIPSSVFVTAGAASIAVSNFSDNTTSAPAPFTIQPRPVVTSASPATIPFNTATPLTVTGVFNSGDQIIFNGTTLSTTGTASQLQATVPASALNLLGPVTVRAVSSLGSLSTTSATVTVIPVITSLNPPSVAAASGSFPLTVNVTGGLLSLSTVSFNGTNFAPTSITATQATVTIPANLILSAGLVPVSISNNGGTSAPVNFTIAAPTQPTITLVSPNSVGVGSGDTVVTVTGTNFKVDASPNYSGARVLFTPPSGPAVGLVPTSNTGTVLTVTIPSSLFLTAGAASMVVSNFSDNTTSAPAPFTIQPRPSITSLSPNSATAGDPDTGVSVTGANFKLDGPGYSGARVLFTPPGGSPVQLTPTSNAGNVLNVTIPAASLVTVGQASVVVKNVTDGTSSGPLAFTIRPRLPSITSLSPNSAIAGDPDTIVLVTGANFKADASGYTGARVLFTPPGGTAAQLTPSSNTGSVLTVTVPAASLVTFGQASVVVTNVTDATVSGPAPFAIRARPTITTLSPNGATAGDNDTTVSVIGTNYRVDGPAYTGARVLFTPPGGTAIQLTPAFNVGNTVNVTIPAANLVTAGQATVVVTNVTDALSSAPSMFTIRGRPVITLVSPNPTQAGGTTALSVTGANFANGDTIMIQAPGCVVRQCFQPLITTFGSSTSLSGNLLGSVIPAQGAYNIYVQNSLNGLSLPSPLTVSLTILSLNPASVIRNVTPLPTLTVQAVGGLTASSVILFNGQALTTVLDSPTQVHATLLPANAATAGPFPVTVQTGSFPPSNALTFTVLSTAPALLSVTPNIVTAADPSTVVTITGSSFLLDGPSYTGARVLFTPPGSTTAVQLTPASNTGTVLTVTIPQAQLGVPGTASVAVTNVSDGTTSGTLPFTIRARPSISSVSPNPTPAGSTVALAVQGANYSNGDVILIGAPGCSTANCLQPLTTTFNSSTSLSGSLLGTLIPLQGTYSIYVQNSLGALSGAAPLTVSLSILTLSPATVTQNAPPPSLVVTSTGGFVQGAVVFFNNQALVTAYDSPTQVHATLTASNVAVAGTFQVAAQNPNSPISNLLPFTVVPQGQLSSINPTSAFAGSGQFTLQLSGSNFQSTDVVRFGNNTLSTNFVNSQSLTAVVPANLLANAAAFAVTVRNSLGNSSNALNFQVTLQITGLSPASVTAAGPAFNLTATLTGGVTQNTVLNYAGTQLSTVSFTSTSITATVPANLFPSAATPPVFATDGTNQSNTVNHLVLGPLTLSSLSPNSVDAGTNGLTLGLTGIGFDSGAFATVSGIQVPTTFINSTSLTAQVPAAMLTTVQTLQVMVTDSRNRQSNQLPLAVLTPLTLSSTNPTFAQAGSPQFNLAVNGNGFDTSIIIRWTNGSAVTNLTTTFVSATQVLAIVPASLLGAVSTASIQAGDSRGRSSNSLSFAIINALTLTNLNPSSAQVGTLVSMILTGSGFTAQPQVLFGGTAIPATLVSDTQISAIIPANVNSIGGTIQVAVRLADGRVSNALAFNAITNPVITGISPAGVDLRVNGLTLTVDGLYFQTGAVIYVNGSALSTTFVGSTRVTAPLPAFTSTGSASVFVVNPGGFTSNTLFIGVGGAKPVPTTLTSLSPQTVAAGGSGFTLTAFGSGFQLGAVINFGSAQLVTTYLNSGQLTGVVPGSLIAQPGSVLVSVSNPDGTSTNSLAFLISGKPIITSLNPPSISAGASSFTLGISGLGFKTGAMVTFGGAILNATFISANQLTAPVPASLVQSPGLVPVVVTNPDGVASDPVNFVVNPFSLTSISPSAANAGGGSFTMTLTGVGFLSGASASFNRNGITTNFVSSTTLTASVPASLIATASIAPVTVTNPDGAVGGPLPFTIRSGITLISINPASIPANSKGTPISAVGSGFVQGASIVFNGNPIATTFGGATSVSGTIPAELLTQTGSFNVTVVNPNGDSSNALNFTVTPAVPLPVITSVSQATAPAGSQPLTLTVNGSGFVQGSTVVFGGTNSATTFVNATQLTAIVSAAQLSQGGSFKILVINPNGDQSNSVDFTVVTALSITSLSPAAASTGGSATLVITGAGIVTGATVQFGSTSLTSDSTSATQVTVQIPGSLLSQSAQVSVTVKNPDGTVSNALTFTIVSLPSINISSTVTAGGTNQVTVTLDSPAPTDLSGTLVLTFVANSSNTPANYVDPAMQFASGGTSINFTILKGATTATFAFSPGTVAGTLTLTLTRLLAGIDNVLPVPPPSKSFTIAPAAPVITANTVKIINGTSTGFTVEVIGFSSSREIKSATLTFTSTQSIDGGGTVTIDLTAAFNNYFASAAGLANGGTFKLDIPFTISGADANVVTAVTVTLTSTVGSSQSVRGGR